MQPVDLSALLEQCKGQWGSRTPSDGVISADKSPKKAEEEAIRKGYKDPILFEVPLDDLPHIG